ncbi:hypothetical protein SAMN05428642_101140 [Flaviramulus basaltis]|uniref:UbiA prenyltransferase family protein n=1 Tax=Flaviramulus basaltis TaxID=369401 RepID=A0A1K2IAK8_9FLAO|nr:hypothetical protein [Flaviramulus basaltis]SFZ89306.1 hypothetical protein SAMN05428642_101140 [Flaviramulus basaltis]
MEVLKKLFNFYIDSSIHVALSVFSLTWITLIEFHVSYTNNVLFFVFFASITGYNFVKYFGIAKFHHRSLTNWLKAVQIFSFFCFLFMCYFGFQLSSKTLLYIGAFGAVTFLYAIPFLPKRLFLDSKHNLRSISGLKIYLIALVWSGVTVFLPLIENEYSINDDVLITAIQRFVLVLVLMLPFEIRDLRYDSLKLSTVPQKIGVKQTKIMGVLLLVVFFFLEFFKNEIDMIKTPILFLISISILVFLIFSKINQGKYYSSFWVEGLPIIWLVLLLIAY